MRKLVAPMALLSLLISTQSHALVLNGTEHADVNGHEAFISAYGESTVTTYSGADVAGLDLYNDTSSTILGGEISFMDLYNNSKTEVSGGDISFLSLHHDSSAQIVGGVISWLRVYDNAQVTIRQMDDLSWLLLSATSSVDIFGHDFSYSGGHLSGYWQDGDYFSIWALEGRSYPSDILPMGITLRSDSVPEPTSLSLMALGFAAMFQYRRRSPKDAVVTQ